MLNRSVADRRGWGRVSWHRGAPAVSATEAPCHAANKELTVTERTIIPDPLSRNGERMGRVFSREFAS
jgi:hypothetical protein